MQKSLISYFTALSTIYSRRQSNISMLIRRLVYFSGWWYGNKASRARSGHIEKSCSSKCNSTKWSLWNSKSEYVFI